MGLHDSLAAALLHDFKVVKFDSANLPIEVSLNIVLVAAVVPLLLEAGGQARPISWRMGTSSTVKFIQASPA